MVHSVKLLMLVSNTFESDARVHRCACALAERGYQVVLLARHREGLPESEKIAGYELIRMRLDGPEPGKIATTQTEAIPRSPRGAGGIAYASLRGIYRGMARVFPPLRTVLWWGIRKSRSGYGYLRRGMSRWKPFDRFFSYAAFQKRKLRLRGYVHLVREYERTIKPDLIHAHDFHPLVAAHEIWKERKIPFVYDSHELWLERNRLDGTVLSEEKAWEESLEREAISNAAFSITVCDSIADHLQRFYGISRPVVVRNTPVRRPAAPQVKKSLRHALQIAPEDFVVLYLGKITYNRGVTDILRAMPLLDRRVKFVTLGYFDPRFQDEFDRTVKELGIEGRVFSFGPVGVDEVSEWIVDCDLSLTTMNRVCLSYTYALPNKLFESLQAGLPIVGPDSPEIERILGRYVCGLTYRDGDSRDLAGKIDNILKSPQAMAAFRAGAKSAGEELCWERERERLWEGYRKAIPSLQPGENANIPLGRQESPAV